MGSSTERNSIPSFMVQYDKGQKSLYWLLQYCHSSNKRVDFKFMKEVKHGYYLSMSEIVAEVNAKIIKVPKTINLHSDGFDICFDYDSFSNKSIVTHGVSKWMDQTCLWEWDSRRMKFCVDLRPLYPYL